MSGHGNFTIQIWEFQELFFHKFRAASLYIKNDETIFICIKHVCIISCCWQHVAHCLQINKRMVTSVPCTTPNAFIVNELVHVDWHFALFLSIFVNNFFCGGYSPSFVDSDLLDYRIVVKISKICVFHNSVLCHNSPLS